LNSSWIAVLMGWTVEEPEMVMEPLSPVGAAAGAVSGDWASAPPPVTSDAARMSDPAMIGRRDVWGISGVSSLVIRHHALVANVCGDAQDREGA
jgi:hypothetical protein